MYNIAFLQDTHWDDKICLTAREEWNYKTMSAPFNTRAKGTSILLNRTFEFTLGAINIRQSGNYSFIELHLPSGLSTILGTMHSPNQYNLAMIQVITDIIEEYENPNVILVGDWH